MFGGGIINLFTCLCPVTFQLIHCQGCYFIRLFESPEIGSKPGYLLCENIIFLIISYFIARPISVLLDNSLAVPLRCLQVSLDLVFDFSAFSDSCLSISRQILASLAPSWGILGDKFSFLFSINSKALIKYFLLVYWISIFSIQWKRGKADEAVRFGSYICFWCETLMTLFQRYRYNRFQRCRYKGIKLSIAYFIFWVLKICQLGFYWSYWCTWNLFHRTLHAYAMVFTKNWYYFLI